MSSIQAQINRLRSEESRLVNERNQARQKLATLPQNRFKDLASDVYYELERRYPDLKDMDVSDPLICVIIHDLFIDF